MSTENQKNAVKELVNTLARKEIVNRKKILRKAGYSVCSSKQASRVMSAEGFRRELAKYFPKDLIRENLMELMTQKEDKRVKLETLRTIIKLLDLEPDKRFKLNAYEERKEVIVEDKE